MLPFIPERKLPVRRKFAGTKKYGFDENEELKGFIASEMMEAMEAGDFYSFLNALAALIEFIRNEDAETHEEA